MQARPNGSYPFKYLEMIDYVFGANDKAIEVCAGTVKVLRQ
jgi:hypothetical protein